MHLRKIQQFRCMIAHYIGSYIKPNITARFAIRKAKRKKRRIILLIACSRYEAWTLAPYSLISVHLGTKLAPSVTVATKCNRPVLDINCLVFLLSVSLHQACGMTQTTSIHLRLSEVCIHVYCVSSLPWHSLAFFVFAHKFTYKYRAHACSMAKTMNSK